MGKRDHGRLVHEIRNALLVSGFQPTKLTQPQAAVNAPPLCIRQPGFTLQKHNDSKSVRLSYRSTGAPSPVAGGLVERQAFGEVMMRRLISHNKALEGAGFVCLEINSQDATAPYSVWRRANSSRS